MQYGLILNQDRYAEVPKELESQLKEQKSKEINAAKKATGRSSKDDSSVEEEKSLDQDEASVWLESTRELVDGEANLMPATCVDQLYAQRSIKKVSSRRPSANVETTDTVPITPRLSTQPPI